MKHTVHHGIQAPALQAVQGLHGVPASADGTLKAVARLAWKEWIAQQIEAVAVPLGVPVQSGWAAGNDGGNAQRGGEVHGSGIVADEETRPGEVADEGGEVRRANDFDAGMKTLGRRLQVADPSDRVGCRQTVGETPKAFDGPTLVGAAGLRMNQDGIGGLASKRRKIGWGWSAFQDRKSGMAQELAHEEPVVAGGSGGWIEGNAVGEQGVQRAVRVEWTHSKRGPGKLGEKMGHIALIIGNQASLGTDLMNRAGMPPELGRMFPGRVEFGRGESEQTYLGQSDFKQRSGERAGGQSDLPIGIPLEQSLQSREKNDVVPKLVDFENEAAHGASRRAGPVR